jgi:hypothetical protein
VQIKAVSVGELKKFNSLDDVNRVLELYPNADAYLPLVSKNQSMVVLILRDTAKINGVVELNPW